MVGGRWSVVCGLWSVAGRWVVVLYYAPSIVQAMSDTFVTFDMLKMKSQSLAPFDQGNARLYVTNS